MCTELKKKHTIQRHFINLKVNDAYFYEQSSWHNTNWLWIELNKKNGELKVSLSTKDQSKLKKNKMHYRSQINALRWIKSIYQLKLRFSVPYCIFCVNMTKTIMFIDWRSHWFSRFESPLEWKKIMLFFSFFSMKRTFRCKNNICLFIFIFIRTRSKHWKNKITKNASISWNHHQSARSEEVWFLSFSFFSPFFSQKWL